MSGQQGKSMDNATIIRIRELLIKGNSVVQISTRTGASKTLINSIRTEMISSGFLDAPVKKVKPKPPKKGGRTKKQKNFGIQGIVRKVSDGSP